MMTIEQALKYGQRLLEKCSETAKLDAEVLLLHSINKDKSYLFAWPEASLNEQQSEQFNTLLEQRKLGKPVAHLIGEREFWSLPLKVNPTTLIPRPDTETLVELALNIANKEQGSCLDLGTGTGAIALALASELPFWHITGCDRIADAVALANENKHSLAIGNCRFVLSDWFSAFEDEQFDLIVSNPPYIDPIDPHLSQGDVRFEPLSALISDKQGMADIETIINQSRHYLVDGGKLIIEHGYDQGKLVRDYFEKMAYKESITIKDLAGNDRVTYATWWY